MLDFVRKSRLKISYIIVYTVDRFSRSGANAIYISEQLKNEGISLISVSQPTDVSTPSGKLQQNIQFIFSEYDNQLRREKTVAGMRNKLLMGEWCIKPPRGYDTIKINGKRSIVPNADGELIRKAFMWRYYERLPQAEIRERLKSLGLAISRSNISDLLRNPFYCGVLVHNMLEGKIVKGKHEKIISKEVFLAINNNSVAGITQGYTILNPAIPLKRTLICEKCGAKMTGYLVRQKELYYYKCSTIGCNINKSASKLHELFVEELKKIDYNSKSFAMLKKELIESIVGVNKVNYYSCTAYTSGLARLKIKIENIEESFVLGKISESLYQKYLTEYQTQKKNVENELDKTKSGLIQRKHQNEEIEKRADDIPAMWQEGNLQVKRLIQLLYDKLT